jgi:hypothetical protein
LITDIQKIFPTNINFPNIRAWTNQTPCIIKLLPSLAFQQHIRILPRQIYLPDTTRDFKCNGCQKYIPTAIYELLRELDAHAYGVRSAIEKSISTQGLGF